jgi:heat shock protein HslJ
VFTEDGKVSGTAGCNSYSGTYTTSGSEIEIKQPMASTMMACPEPVMKQEADYFLALAAAKSFIIRSNQLILKDANDTELVSYTVQAQDLPNTTWFALSYNNGKQAVVSVMADTELTATFEGDGSLTGFAGCNNFNGPYKTNGLNIKIGPLASTMKSCEAPEGVMDQEAQYLAALQSAATYSRLGDRLELRTADGALAAEFIRNE